MATISPPIRASKEFIDLVYEINYRRRKLGLKKLTASEITRKIAQKYQEGIYYEEFFKL